MSGSLYRVKTSVNMKYKLGIRDAYNALERTHDDAIHVHWLSKIHKNFGKHGGANTLRKSMFVYISLFAQLMPALQMSLLITSVNLSMTLLLIIPLMVNLYRKIHPCMTLLNT